MENDYHKIRVRLHDNVLTEGPNDYMAVVDSERSPSVPEICKRAVKRGGADISAAAMEHGAELFLKEMAYQLCDGYSVNTGYFVANAQVRGVFHGKNEMFDPAKHAILFRFNQGERMRKLIPDIQVVVAGVADSGIVISHIVDVKTGSVNDAITPGGTLKIKGGKLKIAGDKPGVGVYFQDLQGNKFYVEPQDMIVNNPSELIVQIPDLPDTYPQFKLGICTQYAVSVMLKEPRTLVYDKPLTVQ